MHGGCSWMVDNAWDLPKIHKFIITLMKLTVCSHVKELKNHLFYQCVWKRVGKELNQDHNSLSNFWYGRLHLQLFCPHPVYLADIKIKLIEYVYQRGVTSLRDINWQRAIKYFDGYTSSFLYRTFNSLIRTAKSKTSRTKFAELIKYLYHEYIPYLVEQPKDYVLPRIIFYEDKVQHIEADLDCDTDEDTCEDE